jgi:hypothetical protein
MVLKRAQPAIISVKPATSANNIMSGPPVKGSVAAPKPLAFAYISFLLFL